MLLDINETTNGQNQRFSAKKNEEFSDSDDDEYSYDGQTDDEEEDDESDDETDSEDDIDDEILDLLHQASVLGRTFRVVSN